MARLWQFLASAVAGVVLAAGLAFAVCPLINRPWAYDVNANLGLGLLAAGASFLLTVVLCWMAGRVASQSPSRPNRRIAATVSSVVVLLGVTAAVWTFALEDRMVAKRFGIVVPASIYRSGQISRHMLEPTLASNEIDVVIDLNGVDPANSDQQYEIETLPLRGVDAHRYKLEGDGRGDVESYIGAIKTIADCQRNGRRVLVHCAAGSQRTGGVVAAYRLLVRQDSVATVMNELRRYGWQPSKDAVLIDYLNDNMSTLARRLHEEGVLKQVPQSLPRLSAEVSPNRG